jgi:hypothetical protein
MTDVATEQGSGTEQGTQTQQTTTTPQGDASTAAGTANQPAQFTYKEDRANWVPPHRITQQTAKQRELEGQLAEANRRVAALAGTQTPDPQDEKVAQSREALMTLFPQLRKFEHLTDEQLDRVLQTPDYVERANANDVQNWTRHGRQQLGVLHSDVASALNQDSLTDDQKADVGESFKAWFKTTVAKELEASGGEVSATLQRYEDGDAKLINEFSKRYIDAWVTPARRQVTAQQTARSRGVPNSQGRAQVTTSVKRPDSFKSIDERIDFAAELYKERGGNFGR